MKYLAAAVVVWWCSVASAGLPVPCIDGPREVHSGALVTLDAGDSAGAETFGWLVDTSAVQVPGTKTPDVSRQVDELRALGFTVAAPVTAAEPLFEVEDGGKRLRLSSYPGVYRVTLGVGNADGLALLEWTVKVVGGKPDPKPDDPDPPDPDPAPTSAIGMLTYAGVLATTNRAGFDEIAKGYRKASQGASGFPNVEALLKSIYDETHKLNAGTLAAWTPIARVLEAQLDVMRDAREIDDTKPATYEKPLKDIADGITKALAQ